LLYGVNLPSAQPARFLAVSVLFLISYISFITFVTMFLVVVWKLLLLCHQLAKCAWKKGQRKCNGKGKTMSKMTLKAKLITIGLAASIIPLVIVFGIVIFQNGEMLKTAEVESLKLGYADLDHMAQNIYGMCEIGNGMLEASGGSSWKDVPEIYDSITELVVGQTGYVFILNSQGDYLISKNGTRDGENIWSAKDDNGVSFIQEICRKAKGLKQHQIAEQQYPWKNDGDAVARMKITRIMYFEDWDWIIGVGSFEDEFMAAKTNIQNVADSGSLFLSIVIIITILITSIIWYIVASRISTSINNVIGQLTAASTQVTSASGQIANSGQELAEGSSNQASSLEEVASSLEELASQTRNNSDNATEANSLVGSTREATISGGESVVRLQDAISRIKDSADKTAKIVKTIDEIAFQTNLLALNAAVEAARAGEAGKGFAVVAEEVRNLAQRSAVAAKETSELIEESQTNSENGVKVSAEVSDILSGITDSVQKVSHLVGEVNAASSEQSSGIEQINLAVSTLEKVTQSNAATAEETAASSEELTAQAKDLESTVLVLEAVVGGSKNGAGYSAPTSPSQPRPNNMQYRPQKAANSAQQASQHRISSSQVIPLDDSDFSDF
jgi:methyl-accepting chemotaxis protein